MADQKDAGAAYLAALRQSRSPQAAAAAPALAPEKQPPSDSRVGKPTPPGKDGPTSKDKRESPRYRCEGSIRLQQSGSHTSTWATFTDISIHGCYIESSIPYPQGTMAEMKLDANGFRVEAVGEVRISYPGLGMGISFVKVSDADRSRLRDLILSISPHTVILGQRLTPQSLSISRSEAASVANPTAALQAMQEFFENRHMMGRDEFLRILRDNP